MRKPITPGEKLAITLRFLATGESFTSLAYQSRISKQSISCFIPIVCSVIYKVLQPTHLKVKIKT